MNEKTDRNRQMGNINWTVRETLRMVASVRQTDITQTDNQHRTDRQSAMDRQTITGQTDNHGTESQHKTQTKKHRHSVGIQIFMGKTDRHKTDKQHRTHRHSWEM